MDARHDGQRQSSTDIMSQSRIVEETRDRNLPGQCVGVALLRSLAFQVLLVGLVLQRSTQSEPTPAKNSRLRGDGVVRDLVRSRSMAA